MGSRLHVDFESNPNLYSAKETTREHRRFLRFLGEFLRADPTDKAWDIPVLDADEREVVLRTWNDTFAERDRARHWHRCSVRRSDGHLIRLR